MDVNRAVRAFAKAKRELPFGAMLWCRDDWPAAAPRFLELLTGYTDGGDRSETTADALLFILHIFAERQEIRAFPTICRLAHDTGAIERVLSDDGITVSLGSILISTFDGDAAPLKRLIEAPEADEFVRVEALNALGYLTASGRITMTATASYLQQLFDTLQPQAESFVWYGWAQVVTLLRLDAELVAQVFARGLIAAELGDASHMDAMREEASQDAGLCESFEREYVGPIDDAIDALSQWAAFSGEDDGEDDEPSDDDATDRDLLDDAAAREEPVINPYRNVGRNDPCPCGSGKKFKKCCLA